MGGTRAADVIAGSPLFAALPTADVTLLAAAAREVALAAREDVFVEGEPARWFCVVVAGRVKIFRQSRAGKAVVLDLLGAGEPFGGVAVIERRPYPASAQATEPSAVLKIPQDALIAVVERHPTLIRAMASMIGQRLRAAHDTVTSLAVDPVEARLAATLLRLAARDGTRGRRGIVLAPHLTRQMLADMSGTTVESAIRIMSRWLREGLVRDEDGRLVLADVAGLRERAEGAATS